MYIWAYFEFAKYFDSNSKIRMIQFQKLLKLT